MTTQFKTGVMITVQFDGQRIHVYKEENGEWMVDFTRFPTSDEAIDYLIERYRVSETTEIET